MTTARINVLPLAALMRAHAPASTAHRPGSIPAIDKKAFSALLAKVETERVPPDREPKTKHTAKKSAAEATPIAQLAPPSQPDNRAWTLALPVKTAVQDGSGPNVLQPKAQRDDPPATKEQPHLKQSPSAPAQRTGETAFTVNFSKAAPVAAPLAHGTSSDGLSHDTPPAAKEDAQLSQSAAATALRHSEAAFAANFVKGVPVAVPPLHSPSSNPLSAVLPGAHAAAPQNGGSPSKHSGKDEHRDPAPHPSEATSAAHAKPDRPGEAAPQVSHSAPAQTTTNAPAGIPAPAAYVTASSAGKVHAAPPSTTASPVAEPPNTAAARPHSMDFRVGGVDERGVDVRVSQRGADVQVTVRTPNADLAESLRQHLPELSDRLSQVGVPGEILRPAGAVGAASDADLDSGRQNGGGAHSPDARSGSGRNNDSNNGSQQQNAWLNELFGTEKEV